MAENSTEDKTNQDPFDKIMDDLKKETNANLDIENIDKPEVAATDNGNGASARPSEAENRQPAPEDGNAEPATNVNATDVNENAAPEPARQRQQPRFDGVSRAYEDPLGDFDLKEPKDKKNTKGKGGGWNIEAPERDRKKTKPSNAKDIMEVCWGIIMDAYTGTIDFVVDNTLDFVEWVLFAPFCKKGKKETKKEKAKKNVYMIGSEFYKERMDNLAGEKEKIIELNENLEKSASGIEPEWKLWKGKPNFFDKLLQIYNRAKENPNSDEAEFLAKYGLGASPDIVRGRFAKEEKVFRIAVRAATLEEAANGSQNAFKQNFDRLKKTLDRKYNKNEVGLLKRDLLIDIKVMIDENGGENTINGDIATKLNTMKEIINSNNDVDVIKKKIKKEVKKLQEICETSAVNDDIIKDHIRKNSRTKYQQVIENIDKIHENFQNNPEELKDTIKNYLMSINEAGKKAKEVTDKVVAPNKISKLKIKLGRSKDMDNARTAVAGIDEAIKNFNISGERISSRHQAAEKDEFILTEKQVATAVRNFNISRQRGA